MKENMNANFYTHPGAYLIFSFFLLFTLKTHAQSYTVNYEEDGFKGRVVFHIEKGATIFKDGLSFKVKTGESRNIIESYMGGKFDAVLNQAGIRFPITEKKTSSSDRIDITGRVYFYLSPQRQTRHQSQPQVRIDPYDGWVNIPDFSQSANEYVINYHEKQKRNLWTETGGLDNLTVKDAYLFELKNKIEAIIKKHEQTQASTSAPNSVKKTAISGSTPLATSSGSLGTPIGGVAKSSASSSASSSTRSYSSASTSVASSQATRTSPLSTEQHQKAEAQRIKMEETQRKIAAMKANLERQQRDAARLDAATKQTFADLNSNSSDPTYYIQAAKPLVNEFARQGNTAGAITAGATGLAMGLSKAIQANKARNEAARAAQEEQHRIWEEERRQREAYEAEQERLRQEAFDLLISQRHTILYAFSDNQAVPLSTTQVGGDKIYYFIYAIDPATINEKNTSVYVSNVFEIARYSDGTWPYQSSLEAEIEGLTPYNEVLHGYYLSADDAENMLAEFKKGFYASDGVRLQEIVYKELPATDLGAENRPAQSAPAPGGGLGISIGPGTKNAKEESPEAAPRPAQTGGLGIPIKM